MRPRKWILGSLSLLLVLLATTAVPRRADAESQKLQYGIVEPAGAEPWDGKCTATSRLWWQEIGKEGVTRLKVQWRLYGPNDIYGAFSYGESVWVHSGSFPDDGTSYHFTAWVGQGGLNFKYGKVFALWANMVGERPSFWQPDISIWANLGEITCVNPDLDPNNPYGSQDGSQGGSGGGSGGSLPPPAPAQPCVNCGGR